MILVHRGEVVMGLVHQALFPETSQGLFSITEYYSLFRQAHPAFCFVSFLFMKMRRLVLRPGPLFPMGCRFLPKEHALSQQESQEIFSERSPFTEGIRRFRTNF